MRRIPAAVTMLALVGTIALGKSERSAQSVTVCINARPVMAAETLPIAEGIAREIFAKAGVHIVWKVGQPKTEIARPTIVVDIKSAVPTSFHPGALAYAQVFEGVHIAVFYDRVESTATRSIVPMLLGHVLAHEITHILEGVDRHSPEGVMKAHWSSADLASMSYKPLPFDTSDVLLIHIGMARRSGVSLAIANLRPKAAPLP